MLALLLTLLTVLRPQPNSPEQAIAWRHGDCEPPPITIHEKPTWIRHRVAPREKLSEVAARYAVKRDDLVRWNKLRSRRVRLRRGQVLKVQTTRVPLPKFSVPYTVREGDSWESIAIANRIDLRHLRNTNWGRKLKPGTDIDLWIDPSRVRRVGCSKHPVPSLAQLVQMHGLTDAQLDAAQGRGAPSYGRLKNAIQLPESELYTRREHLRLLWASGHTIRQIFRAFAQLRYADGFDGRIMIGSISLKRGRRFPPHRSHQSGRDIDIRLPLLPGLPDTAYPNPDEVDWLATWALIKAFIDTGEVSMIFFDGKLQKKIYQAARWQGYTPEELAQWIHWPSRSGKKTAIVRHSKGHTGHIHVRLKCGPNEPRCRGT